MYEIGTKIKIPEYNKIEAHFGTDGGKLNIFPPFDETGEMKEMCGNLYSITTKTNTAIGIMGKSGTTWFFNNEIFNTVPEKIYVGIKKSKDINTIIHNQIKHRYEMVSLRKMKKTGTKLKIVDSAYPYEKLMQEQSGNKTPRDPGKYSVCISERISKEFNIRQLNIEELITFLGYTKTDIKKYMTELKKIRPNLVIVGYGGTGTNFLHWMSQLALMTGHTNIFKDIVLADDDYFDTANLFRIPFILPDLGTDQLMKKQYYWKNYANISEDMMIQSEKITSKNTLKNYIYYGAPDLETRKILDEAKIPFVAATHRNEDCALMLRPTMDTELMVETYGKISLTTFFLNHLRMTIGFIEFLIDPETTNKVLTGKEKSILTYSFKNENPEIMKTGHVLNRRTYVPITAEPENTIIL